MFGKMNKEMKVKTLQRLCGMLAMLACCACSSNSDDAVADDPQFWTVTLTASMGDATTRALSENGNDISASFTAGDIVEVVNATGNSLGTLTAQSTGASTTLSGTLTGSLAVNDVLTLHYLGATANYDGQVGTLAGISDSQNFAEGTITVSSTSPLTFTPSPVSLTSKQSITKFSFTCGGNAVSVKTFGIAAPGLVQRIATNGSETVGVVTGSLATASADVYIALRNNISGKQKYSFTIQDGAGLWYTGTKSAPLVNGKNYTASVSLTQLPALSSNDAVGTIGVVDGLPAIVVDFSGTKKAVALMNTGALCPEAYGTYYTFANQSSGLANGWYVPTRTELEALAAITNAWTTQNGVNGRLFTISTGKTLFLPAAGFVDNKYSNGLSNVTTFGYYWSSTNYDETYAYSLQFSSAVNNTNSSYQVDGLPVRPFHELSTLNLSSPALGQVIGSDGRNYAANASLPAGVNKVAVIVHLDGSHGLALALQDAETMSSWANANTAAANATPRFTNGTWRLPTNDDWWKIFGQTGDIVTNKDFTSTDLPGYITGAGGSGFIHYTSYWSATERDSEYAWVLYVKEVAENSIVATINGVLKTEANKTVRLCLAF